MQKTKIFWILNINKLNLNENYMHSDHDVDD